MPFLGGARLSGQVLKRVGMLGRKVEPGEEVKGFGEGEIAAVVEAARNSGQTANFLPWCSPPGRPIDMGGGI